MFFYSIFYLALLFVALLIDRSSCDTMTTEGDPCHVHLDHHRPHGPHAGGRCGRKGQIRPPRFAPGCAEIGTALFAAPCDTTRPLPTGLTATGHLSVARLHAAVRAAALERLRRHHGRFEKLSAAGSRTPGHPEYGYTPGVETTTGPLGQGFGNAVGMALAERMLAARYNRPGYDIVDHYTYVLASDGDMMEGIASEAASIAGHLKLHKLIVIYDDNKITIDGSTDLAFTESVADRFKAYGWSVETMTAMTWRPSRPP